MRHAGHGSFARVVIASDQRAFTSDGLRIVFHDCSLTARGDQLSTARIAEFLQRAGVKRTGHQVNTWRAKAVQFQVELTPYGGLDGGPVRMAGRRRGGGGRG